MPDLKPGESRNDWMKRCVPALVGEGREKDQATAACSGMWEKANFSEEEFSVEVMSVGTWNDVTFKIKDLDEMAGNFNTLKDIVKPPIKLGHTEDKPGDPAFGWITGLKRTGEKLIAQVRNVPALLMDAIKAKRYRRVSSEVYFDYEYNGKRYGKVLAALALLGAETPAVKDLKDLQAYLTQNTIDGTYDKMVSFESSSEFIFTPNNKKEEGNMPSDIEKKLAEFSDKLALLTSENQALKEKIEQAKKEKEKIEKEKTDLELARFEDKKKGTLAEFKTFCDERVKAGKMLPAQRDLLFKDKAVNFTEEGEVAISTKLFKEFSELGGKILDESEKANSGEESSETFSDVQEEMDMKVRKFMSEKKIDNYVEAFEAVCFADQDLAKRYSRNISTGQFKDE